MYDGIACYQTEDLPIMALKMFSLSVVLAVVHTAAQTAQADNAPAPPLPEVAVTAPRPPTPQELAGEAVRNFIASHAVPSVAIHQLTRWRIGICPISLGLSSAFNEFVVARIDAVANAVGAPHQSAAQCKHNVLILFTNDPQGQLDAVMKKGSALLGYHYSQQTKKLATFNRPIQGWYVTSTRNFKGVEAMDEPLQLPITNSRYWNRVPPGEPGSRLTNLRRSLIIQALVLVDTNKVRGLTIGSISDYLTMLILSQSESPDTCSQLPSILDLMASNCGDREKPTQVTAGDLAFLRALYLADLEQPLELEQSSIQNNMMRQFDRR
jgi:hypothetical protein